MRKLFFAAIAVLLVAGLASCGAKKGESVITISVTDGKTKDVPVIYLPDGNQIPVELSSQADGVAAVDVNGGTYVRLGYKYTSRLLWIVPGSEVNVSFESEKFYKGIEVAGANADINGFLNSNVYKYATIDDCKLGEQEYITLAQNLLENNLDLLSNQGFSGEFAKKEEIRLKYYTYQIFPSFRYFHSRIANEPDYKESESYFAKMKELAVYNGEYLASEDYQKFIYESVLLLSAQEYPHLKGIDRLVAFIEKNVADAKVAQYLVNRRVCAYLKKNGLAGVEPYLDAFSKYVSDTVMVNNMQALKEKMGKCSEGAVSPDFNSTDVDGKQYTLADFAGKYVYIDVWATWCGPCRKEAPYLAELEHKFNGEGVYFVGLSCDKSREAWEKAVRAGEVKGIQLYLEPGNTFMDDYSITGIPRFILLDKEGKILSAKATAPSDPKTEETIANLLAK